MPSLAAMIRQKYPGSYDQYDDATLEALILKKYPQYKYLAKQTPDAEVSAAKPKPEAVVPPPEKESGFLDSILNSTIGKSLVKGLVEGAPELKMLPPEKYPGATRDDLTGSLSRASMYPVSAVESIYNKLVRPLTSPTNLVAMAAMATHPESIPLFSSYFGAQGATQLPNQLSQAGETLDEQGVTSPDFLEQAGDIGLNLATTLGIPAGAAAHLAKAPAISPMRFDVAPPDVAPMPAVMETPSFRTALPPAMNPARFISGEKGLADASIQNQFDVGPVNSPLIQNAYDIGSVDSPVAPQGIKTIENPPSLGGMEFTQFQSMISDVRDALQRAQDEVTNTMRAKDPSFVAPPNITLDQARLIAIEKLDGAPTVKPAEFGETVNVPPDIAATYGKTLSGNSQKVGQDFLINEDPTMEALTPSSLQMPAAERARRVVKSYEAPFDEAAFTQQLAAKELTTQALRNKRGQPRAIPMDERANIILDTAKETVKDPEIKQAVQQTKILQDQLQPLGKIREIYNDRFKSVENELKDYGPAGVELSRISALSEHEARIKASSDDSMLDAVTKDLNTEETTNLHLAANGFEAPINSRVAAALKVVKEISADIVRSAKEVGLFMRNKANELIPFEGLENHAPIRYPKGFWNDTPTVIEGLVKKGLKPEQALKVAKALKKRGSDFVTQLIQEGKSPAEAEAILEMSREHGVKLGSAQHSRTFTIPGYRTDLGVWKEHFWEMRRNIERARVFGPEDIGKTPDFVTKATGRTSSKAVDLINQTTNIPRVYELMKTVLGRTEPGTAAERAFNNSTRAAMTTYHLPMFVISNTGGGISAVAMRYSVSNMLGQVAKSLNEAKQFKEIASKSGAWYNISRGIADEGAKWYHPEKLYGMNASENFNRAVAAGAARGWAVTLLDTLKSTVEGKRKYQRAYNGLKDLLMESDEGMTRVLKQNALTDHQLDLVGGRGAELTQGLPSARKLPRLWSQQKILTQTILTFQKYAFQGTTIMRDWIMENPAVNIPKAIAISQITGALVSNAKAAVKGSFRAAGEQDTDAAKFVMEHQADYAKRYFEDLPVIGEHEAAVNFAAHFTNNMLQSWALGLGADMLDMASGDSKSAIAALAGPAIGDVSRLIFDDAIPAMGGNFVPLAKEGIRAMPVAGPGLQQAWLPTRKQRRSKEQTMLEKLLVKPPKTKYGTISDSFSPMQF